MTDQETFDVVAEIRVMKNELEHFKENVKTHIEQGERWRVAIMMVIFSIVLQVVTFSALWGGLNTRVMFNEKLLDKALQSMEKNYPIIVGEKNARQTENSKMP